MPLDEMQGRCGIIVDNNYKTLNYGKVKTMTARERQEAEIERLKVAIEKTESPYLRKDYTKAVRRLTRELKEYDRLRKGYV